MKNFKVGDVVYLKQKIEEYGSLSLDLSFEVEHISPEAFYPYGLNPNLTFFPDPTVWVHEDEIISENEYFLQKALGFK